ncbi:hypothetical protein [Kineococcus terrestris]|uniref:hypothetical protein n=1 Tax=Kineococcus terrestris TaxID=2044856 RepID=UPI0034DB7971
MNPQPLFSDRNQAAIDAVVAATSTDPSTRAAGRQALAQLPAGPRTWTVRVPALLDAQRRAMWLTANQREHWRPRAHKVAVWREHGRILALTNRLPRGVQRVHVLAVVHYPTTTRNRDVLNLAPTLKALLDGLLVDSGFLPDDNDRHLVGPDLRPGEAADRPTIVLTITEEPS